MSTLQNAGNIVMLMLFLLTIITASYSMADYLLRPEVVAGGLMLCCVAIGWATMR